MKDLQEIYDIFRQHPVITTDSRKVPPDSVFFALKGEQFDGNLFASEALDKGAAFAVVDNHSVVQNKKYILVTNVLETLQQLAFIHRTLMPARVIGITGTNGKTTTKELVAAVLSSAYETASTQGNLNNHIGVPLTILSLKDYHQFAVIEIGANHPGEITALCRIARPGFGIITNIGKAHLEGFGGFKGVIRAKSELYQFISETGGTIFINDDDDLLKKLSAGINQVSYGSSAGCACRGLILRNDPFLTIEWLIDDQKLEINTNLFGAYNFTNVMAAISAGAFFKVSSTFIQKSISSYKPENNRSEFLQTGRNKLYLDAYNANPSSMKAALINFSGIKAEKKMVILGEMLELGDESNIEHQNILSLLREMKIDMVILIGPVFSKQSENQDYLCFPDAEKARSWLARSACSGYSILLKGSRKMRLELLKEML